MKVYTGIGSRDTPREIQNIMEKVAYAMASNGWTVRSGGAKGADSAFYRGWMRWANSHREEAKENPLAQIYLPWENFNGQTSSMIGNVLVKSEHKLEKALEMAEKLHPAWEKCSPAAQVLHSRNCFQILGAKLNEPSKLVVFWAPEKNGEVQGGTATAVKLAKELGITTYNLLFEEVQEKMLKFLEKE